MEDINGYGLSRSFFDWCFENPEKVSPTHVAMYFFIIEQCNRLGWKEKFGLPTVMVKDAIGIKNFRTYVNTLNDLVEWGFVKMIEKSKNQYSSNIIAIVKNAKASAKASTKALDKALQKHSTKQSKSIDSIDKQVTLEQLTIETINYEDTFDSFRKLFLGTKRGNETEFENFQKHKDWKECLYLLLPALKNQIKVRDLKKQKGEFVPEWKNLKTWINQRCWEEETTVIQAQSQRVQGPPM